MRVWSAGRGSCRQTGAQVGNPASGKTARARPTVALGASERWVSVQGRALDRKRQDGPLSANLKVRNKEGCVRNEEPQGHLSPSLPATTQRAFLRIVLQNHGGFLKDEASCGKVGATVLLSDLA